MDSSKPCSNGFSVLLQLRLYTCHTANDVSADGWVSMYRTTEVNRNTQRIKIKYWYYIVKQMTKIMKIIWIINNLRNILCQEISKKLIFLKK